MPSFDVVSKVDLQEVDNAVNQARKEINNRYDFRGSKCEIEYNKGEEITLLASDEMKLKAMQTILNERLSARNISVRSLDYQDPEGASGGSQRQKVLIKQGISSEDCKKIVKALKDAGLKKTQAQIQKDQVRITGPKRDDLQAAIALMRDKIDLDLQFVNFKD